MPLGILVLLIVMALLARNLPLALRPFLRPPEERRYTAAIVPMTTVVLALVFLVVAMKNLNAPLISCAK